MSNLKSLWMIIILLSLLLDPAEKVALAVNSEEKDLTVRETENVTFTCTAEGGRPKPRLILADQDQKKVSRNESLLTYTLTNARCEDSGEYRCTADNGMGPDKTTSRTLNVTCMYSLLCAVKLKT